MNLFYIFKYFNLRIIDLYMNDVTKHCYPYFIYHDNILINFNINNGY